MHTIASRLYLSRLRGGALRCCGRGSLTRSAPEAKGTFFRNHFVTTALCCPSRVSLWTGRQAHNTNVTDVSPPYGGYPKFNAGYDTYYAGKLFNAHTVDNYHSPYVNGFNGSDFLLDPYTYSYLNTPYQQNQNAPVSYEGRHTVEVITEKALGFLDDALADDRPFFITVAPVAPHSNVDTGTMDTDLPTGLTEPIPLDRHKDPFEGVTIPRTEHFNPDQPSGVNWIRTLAKQHEETVAYHDLFYRRRLQSLQGVDELVNSLVTKLEASGQADNTYIIYTSDNGYHIGQHRLPWARFGVEADKDENAVTTHIDLVPSIFDLAGIPVREDFDRTPIPLPSSAGTAHPRHGHVTVEYWGIAYLEGEKGTLANPSHIPFVLNNTYKSVRIIGEDYNLYYSVWCNNEHELYDLTVSCSSFFSGYANANFIDRPVPIEQPLLSARSGTGLRGRASLLQPAKGSTCIKPWDGLHPDGDVQNLQDALGSQYDEFYANQARSEGPQEALSYSRYGLSWDAWA
ncbi:alkaline-phosphatase-like protein [Aspergillus oleicola]